MTKQWDTAVIGAGAAGLSAARVIAAAGLSCICLEKLGPGGMLINLGPLHGHMPPMQGVDFGAALLDAATAAGVELAIGEVRAVRQGACWQVETDDESHAARVVVLATGLTDGTLGVAGEAAFEGYGLSHCAACDGPLYRGANVVVAGSGRWAAQEAADLLAIAGQVTLVAAPQARLATPPGVGRVDGVIVALEGRDGLEAVVVAQDGENRRLPARAVFVLDGRRPALAFAPAEMARDPTGRARVDAGLRTNLPAVYAIGDVRSGAAEDVRAAIEDGDRAGRAIVTLLTGSGSYGKDNE